MAENTIAEIKKFFMFTRDGTQKMTIAQFKAEWDQLSEEEKDWFRKQPLE